MMNEQKKSAAGKIAVLQQTLKVCALVLCAIYAGADLFIIFSRIFYPYQLEWMEGAGLAQAQRIIMGKSLYAAPSVDYVALIYSPLFYYLAALVAKVIGLGFGSLRLVSFASSALCALVVYWLVSEKTESPAAGWLGAGIFASAFMLTGQWFDIARPDMLAAALSMLGIYWARETKSGESGLRRDLLAGLMFALAFLTKQSGLIVGLAAIAYHLLFNWRRGARLALCFGIFTGAIYGLFWLNSAGWINYYLFKIPAAHVFNFSAGRVVSVLIDQFRPIPIFLLAAILPIMVSPRNILADRAHRYFYAMAAALIVTGLIGRLNAFSGRNVYVPTYLGIALLAGAEWGWLADFIRQPALQRNGLAISTLQALLLAAQFGFMAPLYINTKTIPSAADLEAGNSLVAQIKSYPGDALLLDNNYLAIYAGKTPYFNQMPMSEISGKGNLYPMPEWPEIQKQIGQLIHSDQVSAVMVDFSDPIREFISNCKQTPIRYADKTVFTPVAGPPNARPNLIIICK